MPIVLYVLSALLLLLVVWDAFITIFSPAGAGPLTGLWTQLVWRNLLAIHAKWKIHPLLQLTGPAILLATILLWYFLLAAGFFLMHAADHDSVVRSQDQQPVGLLQRLYYVGSTVSSLGYGDLVPSGFPWTLAAGLAALAATVVLTVSLSYVISVISASIQRRQLAQEIFGLGCRVEEIVERSGFDDGASSLKQHFLSVSSMVNQHALNHLAYPILNFFHSVREDQSPARAILLLSDAFFVFHALAESRQPPPGLRAVVESSVVNYIELVRTGIIEQKSEEDGAERLVEIVHQLGGPAEGEEVFREKLDQYLVRRRKLLALCKEDGWEAT